LGGKRRGKLPPLSFGRKGHSAPLRLETDGIRCRPGEKSQHAPATAKWVEVSHLEIHIKGTTSVLTEESLQPGERLSLSIPREGDRYLLPPSWDGESPPVFAGGKEVNSFGKKGGVKRREEDGKPLCHFKEKVLAWQVGTTTASESSGKGSITRF